MKEVFHQIPPDTFEKQAKLEQVDLSVLKQEFEARMQDYRRARTVIINEDGSRTIYEAYRMPIFREQHLIETYIERFCHEASLLGYKSTIGPLVVPSTQKMFGDRNQTRPSIFFFLEKKEV
jgi:hypothetical protein